MESDCLAGVSGPSGGDAVFTFSGNNVTYANRDALRLNLSSTAGVLLNLTGNLFERECSCEGDRWLRMLCGDFRRLEDEPDVSGLLRNGSLCRLRESARRCFDGASHATFTEYHEIMCVVRQQEDFAGDDDDRAGLSGCGEPTRLEELWQVVREQADVGTNKGILKVILAFTLAASLLVSICTLLRWLVYALMERGRPKVDDEWNFTKIEQRRMLVQQNDDCRTPTPAGGDHYESLPLTKEEDLDGEEEEEEGGASVQTSRSDVIGEKMVAEVHSSGADDDAGSKSEAASCATTSPGRISAASAKVQEVKKEKEEEEGIGKPPKMTFYDEMIDLLKEKLEDPDNYATVADNSSGGPGSGAVSRGQQSLYQDPFEVAARQA